MKGNTLNPEQQGLTPKQNRPHGLAFLKVGLFEIIFVAIALLLLFGTLNYFNILSVSDVFPNQLGWLPRQAIQQSNNLTITPSPINYTPNAFNYDTKKAEALLTQYIKDTVKPELLPSKIEVKQGLAMNGVIQDVKYEFGYFLTSNNSTVSANFHYKESSNTQNDFEVFILPPNTNQTTLTPALANSILSSYFTNPYIVSSCQTKEIITSCENFQTLNTGKKGYGIALLDSGSKISPIIINCFIPKESKDYDSTKSCIRL